MSWGVKTTCLEAPGVSLGGSGVSIGGVRSLRVMCIISIFGKKTPHVSTSSVLKENNYSKSEVV